MRNLKREMPHPLHPHSRRASEKEKKRMIPSFLSTCDLHPSALCPLPFFHPPFALISLFSFFLLSLSFSSTPTPLPFPLLILSPSFSSSLPSSLLHLTPQKTRLHHGSQNYIKKKRTSFLFLLLLLLLLLAHGQCRLAPQSGSGPGTPEPHG